MRTRLRLVPGRAGRARPRPRVAVSAILGPMGLGIALFPGALPGLAQEAVPVPPELATRISPTLRAAMMDGAGQERIPIVVEFVTDEPAPAAVAPSGAVPLLQRRAESALGTLSFLAPPDDPEIRITDRLWVVPAALAEATRDGILRLAAGASVKRVWYDGPLPVRLPPSASVFIEPAYTSQAMRTIGADAVWQRGVTGIGTTLAIFDSGVNAGNAMLSARWRGRRTGGRASWFDPFRGASEPQDLIGHGTQVAVAAVGGLAAGDSLFLSDGSVIEASSSTDVVTGPAPEAEWIAARVFDTLAGGVYTRRSVLLQAFQWAIDPDGNPATEDAPDVINNSWGIAPQTGDLDPCEDVIYEAIDAVEAAGIAVLFATGNSGPAAGSVAAPAARDDPALRSFGVGATAGIPPEIGAAEYSGRGPSPCSGGIKPDLSAPGTVPEVRARSSGSARLTGFAVQGTSYAVAQASASVALLKQVRPGAGPEELKRVLLDTAEDIGLPGPDNDTGAGLLDVPAAVSSFGAAIAGPLLQLEGASIGGDRITIRLRNRSGTDWPGGRMTVRPVSGEPAAEVVEGDLPAIRAGLGLDVRMPAAGLGTAGTVEVTVTNLEAEAVLSGYLLIAPPNLFGGFVLETGSLRAGANDFGRLGRVATRPGFEWRGVDYLPAGGFGLASAGRVSDGFFVTTLGRADQKESPAAIDTDWSAQRPLTSVEATAATVRFDDFAALQPLQLEVRSTLEASETTGVAALTFTAWLTNRSGATLSDAIPAMLADWDFAGGETIRWSTELEALVAEPRDGEGPLLILAGDGNTIAEADVPLGSPGIGGFYEAESGILWGEFSEELKLALMGGGPTADLPGAATATDRAALLGLAPVTLPPGMELATRFWLLASDSEAAAATRLAALRAEPIEGPGGGDAFEVEPPYPNPLRVGEGVIRFPVRVPAGLPVGEGTVVLEIYDVAGRLMYRQSVPIGPSGGEPALSWDGRLAGGTSAAAGVYVFVIELDEERRTGRLLLVR